MKVFLFLYPVRQYFVHAIGYHEYDPEIADAQVGYFNQVIDARYRQKGFTVAWASFCQSDDTTKIDRAMLENRLDFKADDLMLNTAQPFTVGDDWRYADMPSLFAQLPGPISLLRLGGFHSDDCVHRLGEFAHTVLGLVGKVLIDEDLTERGVYPARIEVDQGEYATRLRLENRRANRLPLDRELTYAGLGYAAEPNWETGRCWQRVRDFRNKHPWWVHE